MQTIKNILDRETLELAEADIQDLRVKQEWGFSTGFWPPILFRNAVIGTVTSAMVSPELEKRITQAIAPHLPLDECESVLIQHYLWHPLSGINMHDDGGHHFGATIYLNPNWDPNWGGLFVYSPCKVEDRIRSEVLDNLQVIYPAYNSININTKKLLHMVTTVSPLIPFPRHTIQIWGKKKPDVNVG